MLLGKEPSKFEVYNDIEGELVNFFRVVKNRPAELLLELDLLPPNSREEFASWLHFHDGGNEPIIHLPDQVEILDRTTPAYLRKEAEELKASLRKRSDYRDVRQVGDYLYFCASRRNVNCPILRTRDPLNEEFEEVSAPFAFWDPDLFQGDDGRVYLYWGCTNTLPIWGIEMDPETMEPIGEKVPLIYGRENLYKILITKCYNTIENRSSCDIIFYVHIGFIQLLLFFRQFRNHVILSERKRVE